MKLTIEQKAAKLEDSLTRIKDLRIYKDMLPDSSAKEVVIKLIDTEIKRINNDTKPKRAKRIKQIMETKIEEVKI